MIAITLSSTAARLPARGKKRSPANAKKNKDLIRLSRSSLLLPLASIRLLRCLPRACCGAQPHEQLGRRSFGRGLGLGLDLGLFLGQPRIHFGRFGGMNLVVVLVRLGQLFAV